MFLTLFTLMSCVCQSAEQDSLLPPDIALASLDLGFVLDDLMLKDELPEDIAERTLHAYRRFLAILLDKQDDEDFMGVPGYLVDLAWHRHILHTKAYWNDTMSVFGHYLGHQPGESAKDDRDKNSRPEQTLQAYRLIFGEEPDLALWDWAVERRRLFSNPNGSPYWDFDFQQNSLSPEPKLGKGSKSWCFAPCFHQHKKLGAAATMNPELGYSTCSPSWPCIFHQHKKLGAAATMNPEPKLGKGGITCFACGPCMCSCKGKNGHKKLGAAATMNPEPKLGKGDICGSCQEGVCQRCYNDKLGAGWRRRALQTGPTFQEAAQEIATADLAFLESRLEHKEGKSKEKSKEMVALYRDFLTEAAKEGRLEDLRATNSEVELVWELHILFTRQYREFSEKIFGRYLHHNV